MDRYSKAISRATRWARSGVDGFRGGARYAMAVLIWSAAVLLIAALMVVATGGLVTDAAKSGNTTLTLKHRVSDAERAHRGAIREAEAELARCQSACDREVTAAKQHLDALCDANGKRLGKCHGITLFERMIATPQGTASLIGARAGVDTAGNLAVTKRATLTRTVAAGLVAGPVGAVVGGAGFKKTKKIDARELYLHIEAPTLSCVLTAPTAEAVGFLGSGCQCPRRDPGLTAVAARRDDSGRFSPAVRPQANRVQVSGRVAISVQD
ncbi:MAG: hypothetical protein ACYCV1_11805, partial [Acidimicrobiales bacterium]